MSQNMKCSTLENSFNNQTLHISRSSPLPPGPPLGIPIQGTVQLLAIKNNNDLQQQKKKTANQRLCFHVCLGFFFFFLLPGPQPQQWLKMEPLRPPSPLLPRLWGRGSLLHLSSNDSGCFLTVFFFFFCRSSVSSPTKTFTERVLSSSKSWVYQVYCIVLNSQ